jgi:hypothetical protein
VKDVIDIVASVGTLLGFVGVGIAWAISRHDSRNKGELAIAQINTMATNCFPTMQRALTDINAKTDSTNGILTDIRLATCETNAILRMGSRTVVTVDKTGV